VAIRHDAGSELACRGVSFCHHGASGHAAAVIGGRVRPASRGLTLGARPLFARSATRPGRQGYPRARSAARLSPCGRPSVQADPPHCAAKGEGSESICFGGAITRRRVHLFVIDGIGLGDPVGLGQGGRRRRAGGTSTTSNAGIGRPVVQHGHQFRTGALNPAWRMSTRFERHGLGGGGGRR
jgi:hypothetical protein